MKIQAAVSHGIGESLKSEGVELAAPGVTNMQPGDHVVLSYAYCAGCRVASKLNQPMVKFTRRGIG